MWHTSAAAKELRCATCLCLPKERVCNTHYLTILCACMRVRVCALIGREKERKREKALTVVERELGLTVVADTSNLLLTHVSGRQVSGRLLHSTHSTHSTHIYKD